MKAKACDFNPVFREYASSAAFRLELSSGMIEFLIWLQEHPQTFENRDGDTHWTRSPAFNGAMTMQPLTRRGLIFHRFVQVQPPGTPEWKRKSGTFITGPTRTEGPGWYQVGLTRAGEIVAQLVREAGWGPTERSEKRASARKEQP